MPAVPRIVPRPATMKMRHRPIDCFVFLDCRV
jgi:hypothetical protein